MSYSSTPLQFRNDSTPLVNANVNTNLVNPGNSHYPGGFGSNQTGCHMGGRKSTIRRKIKNIVNKYKKMKGGKKLTLRGLKKRLTSLYKNKGGLRKGLRKSKRKSSKSRRTKSRRSIKQRGGQYSQYGSSIPNTPSYSTGGQLSPADSALAIPVPHQVLSRLVNGVDNYNHYTGKGFQV